MIGNRYFSHMIGGNLVHRRPFEVILSEELTGGFGEGSYVVCAVDFEEEDLSFFCNGEKLVSMKMPHTFYGATIVPIIGLTNTTVKLNLKKQSYDIAELNDYLSIQEYQLQDKSSYLWDYHPAVEWTNLFLYAAVEEEEQPEPDVIRAARFVMSVFECLTRKELGAARRVCGLFNQIIGQSSLLHQAKLQCYFSHGSFASNTIGMLLRPKFRHIRRKPKKGRKAPSGPFISDVFVSHDHVSCKVWDEAKIRVDSTNEKFTHFLPLVINESHGKKALNRIRKFLAILAGEEGFTPAIGLNVLTALLSG